MGQRDRAARPAVPVASHRNRIACHVRADQPKDLGENEIEFVASTAQVASDGKVIREAAWESSIARIRESGRAPKVFAAHQAAYPDGRQPVIGLIPLESIRIEPGVGLVHRIRFATEDVHPEGPRYYAAYRDNYLDNVSVGWDKEKLAPEAEWADRAIPEVADLEWLETSCVGIGADSGAVKRARAAGQYEVASLLTNLCDTQRAQRAAFAARVRTEGISLALDTLRALCAGCADKAIARFGVGVQAITVRAMPDSLKDGLCAKVTTPEFMAQCQGSDFGEGVDAAEFCAWLASECAGATPEGEATDDEEVAEDGGLAADPPDATRMVEENHPDCPSEKPFALVDASGKVLGCHDTEDAAKAQESAIKAEEAKAGEAAAAPAQHAYTPRRTRRVANALSAGDVSARLGDIPATRAALASTFSQYLSAGQDRLVTPTDEGSHAPSLASGGYAIVGTSRWPGFGFLPVRAETDTLAIFAEHPAERVLAEIDAFWGLAKRYAKLGLQHRRGLLLYGPPGTGKTACLHLVRAHMAAAGEVVLDASNADPWMLRDALHAIREVEPERPITVIVEDIERWGAHGETELLALLDGQHSIGRCLLIASTNYRASMSPRMLRMGRFDLHVEVGPPSATGRLAYFTAKLARAAVAPEVLADLAARTDGWTYSQLRELIIAHFAHGQGLDESCARIAGTPEPAPLVAPESTDPAGLARLADTVQAFAADRADAAQDTRVMVHEIREAVDAMQRTLDALPKVLAQAVTEAVGAERQKPPATVTFRVSPTQSADTEQNERQRVSALLGDLTALHEEAKRLIGATQ